MLLPRADQPKLANKGSDIAALRMISMVVELPSRSTGPVQAPCLHRVRFLARIVMSQARLPSRQRHTEKIDAVVFSSVQLADLSVDLPHDVFPRLHGTVHGLCDVTARTLARSLAAKQLVKERRAELLHRRETSVMPGQKAMTNYIDKTLCIYTHDKGFGARDTATLRTPVGRRHRGCHLKKRRDRA